VHAITQLTQQNLKSAVGLQGHSDEYYTIRYDTIRWWGFNV